MTEVNYKLEDTLPILLIGTVLAIIYLVDGLMLVARKKGENETDKEKKGRVMWGFIKIIISILAAGVSWYWYMNMKNKAQH